MEMTPEEICRSYRQSAFPKKQVGILAELNQVTKTEIVEILSRGGCDVILRKGSSRIKWTDELIEKLRKLRESGVSVKDIAVELGVGRQAIATKLSVEGIVKQRKINVNY